MNGRMRRAWAGATVGVLALATAGAAMAPAGASANRRAASGFDWAFASGAQRPPTLFGPTAAYDSATSQLLMFGGATTDTLTARDTTQLWTGTKWKTLSPAHHPSSRYGAAMAFDPVNEQLILFGGFGGDDGNSFLSDTWSWTGDDWVHLHPAAHPSRRFDPVAAADAATGLVLFGGYDGTQVLGDTWQWTGSTWSPVATDAAPPPRTDAAFSDDGARGDLVLFGGYGSSASLDDTWRWTGTEWIDAAPAHAPTPRRGMSMAFDPVIAEVVLFGGYDSLTTSYQQTWTWDGVDWTQQLAQHSPNRRSGGALAFDAATQNLVLFGGDAGLAYGDTWTGPTREDDTAPTIVGATAPIRFTDPFVVEFSESVAVPCCDAITVTTDGGSVLPTTATCSTSPDPDGRCETWMIDHAAALVPGQHYDLAFDDAITDWVGNPLVATSLPVRASTAVREDDPLLHERWDAVKNPGALGGSYSTEHTAGATYRFSFTGTSLRWLTVTGPDEGKAFVRITNRGGHKVSRVVDNFASSTTLDAPVDFTGLVNTRHTILITVDAAANVAVDGFELDGSVVVPTPKAIMRFPQRFLGSDTYGFTTTPGAAFSTTFRGTSLTWVAPVGPDGGRARVLVDGAPVAVVNLYAKADGFRNYQFPTSDALHRVDVVVLPRKSGNHTGTTVGLVRFDIG
jgi:hypothetical protein